MEKSIRLIDCQDLCSGTLTIEVEGKTYNINNCLCSGGSVWFDEGWDEHIEYGDWYIHDLPHELDEYYGEITELVNDNISKGCCGCCI